ncbi:GntR family transcriptional regulator [Pseudomonas gingeri]|uniref:GntR family transcriptional regulator n=1 Tax=Pseudomonas gingeri TaxID=117681 RepID=UPI0015A25B1A|nr:GntR family transcriptional regulator [Pseudomonas gingeri]NWE97381.1 GntR family transcriptional regulator [Pseudomonas gingeri]
MSLLKVPKVIKRPAEVQAADVLRESIMSGTILPGARVTEVQLAEEMGLSRATVRSALHQLEKEGLTTLIPYTGWTVISLTPKDVWELYTLRSSVERLAAQLVAANMDDTRRKRLNRLMQVLVDACESDSPDKIAEADFALHKGIITLADHSRLLSQYEFIERQIRLYIRSSDSLIEDGETIVEQHRPFVNAILAGDARTAGALSEAHNLSEGQKLIDHLQELMPDNSAISPEGRLKHLKPRGKN